MKAIAEIPKTTSKKSSFFEGTFNSEKNNSEKREDQKSIPNQGHGFDMSHISILPSSSSRVQPKLKIGQPNDKYELEADRVADQIMRMPNSSVQRKCSKCDEEEKIQTKANGQTPQMASSPLSDQIQNSKGGGKSMDQRTQSFMSSRFGTDFSGVRIHTNPTSAHMNQEINAKAFTVGNDVYFNRGEYRPGSVEGRKLLAHELTHVVQQSNPTNLKAVSPNTAAISRSSDRDIIRLKRGPDVVFNKHHSFYLLTGGKQVMAMQFFYSGTGNKVEVKMASRTKPILVKENFTLTNPSKFAPQIVYEDGKTTIFDLDGDNKGDIEVHVTQDAQYSIDFLTSDSNPRNPKYKTHQIKDTFAIMKWPGVEKVIKFSVGMEQQAWVKRPHPHPNIHFMYYNLVTKEAFIPSKFTMSSGFVGESKGKTVLTKKEITVLDWGESWNGFNVAGGVLTWGQIDASSVENMVKSILKGVGPGDCINKLTIIGHGSPGSISVGDGTSRVSGKNINGGALDSTSGIYDAKLATKLAKLTPKFCSNANVELRGCNVGDGKLGKQFTQLLANLWRVKTKAHIGTIRGGGYWTTGKWTSATPTNKKMK